MRRGGTSPRGGTGSVSAELARLGWSVLASDASVGMLNVARRRFPGAEADRVLAEAARVLRPGGSYVTTVDKDLAHGRLRRTEGDHRERVEHVARRFGLACAGSAAFEATTQWASGPDGQRFPVAAFRRT